MFSNNSKLEARVAKLEAELKLLWKHSYGLSSFLNRQVEIKELIKNITPYTKYTFIINYDQQLIFEYANEYEHVGAWTVEQFRSRVNSTVAEWHLKNCGKKPKRK